MKAIKDAFRKTMKLAEQDYKSSVNTWEHKPKFEFVEPEGKNYKITVGTNDNIFGWVDKGTKPHRIPKFGSKYLRFSSGYRAKTRVGIIGSNPGGAFGATVSAMSVQHPGTEARKFTVTIRKRRQVTMEQEVSHAVAKVNRTQK